MYTKLAKILQNNIVFTDSNGKMPFLTIRNTNQLACYIEAKDYDGNTRYLNPAIYEGNYEYVSGNVSGSSKGIIVGSGTTPATEDDYCLENKISGLSGSVVSNITGFDTTGNNYYSILNITLTNNSASDVTVSEVGRIVNMYSAGSKGSTSVSNRYAFLLERTVLDVPVTIEAGSSALIEYRVDYEPVEDPEPEPEPEP